jgi:hypothetical protein
MITYDWPIPPSVNRLRRVDFKQHRLLTKWRDRADALVMLQKRGPLPRLTSPVEIHVVVKDTYHGDLDNVFKVLCDNLVRLAIIPDDSPKYVKRIVMEFGEAPEGVRITLKPWNPLPNVTGRRRRAMLAYVAAHPQGVDCRQIMDHVYEDDEDGGPESRQVVPKMAHDINLQIVSQGWRITSTGGPGSLYRLVSVEPEPTIPRHESDWLDSLVKAGP